MLINNKRKILENYCKSKSVLDIDCVGRMGDHKDLAKYTHDTIREVAKEVIGIDVNRNSIERLNKKGYKRIYGDAGNPHLNASWIIKIILSLTVCLQFLNHIQLSFATETRTFLTSSYIGIGLNYSTTSETRISDFTATHTHLMIGDAYRVPGIQTIAYMGPTTLYGDAIFEQKPESKNWLARDRDGDPLRPWGASWGGKRYAGCVNNPGWLEYQKSIIKHHGANGAVGVFLDDVFRLNCYCDFCIQKFRAYLGEHFDAATLKEMGVRNMNLVLPPSVAQLRDFTQCRNRLEREYLTFAQQSVIEFVKALRDYGRELDPNFILSANISQPGRPFFLDLGAAAIDLWVYEEGPHTMAPLHNNVLRYQQGFARAYRKPVGMLLGCNGWAQRDAAPTEYCVSIAEGTACGGEFVLHYGHAGRPNEVLRINPACKDAIAKYRGFINRYNEYFTNMRPVARIVLLDSDKSAKNDRQYYPHLRELHSLLVYSGVPFTLLCTETDLMQIFDCDVAIICKANLLSNDEIKMIGQFVDKGGTLIVVGDRHSDFCQEKIVLFEKMPSLKELLNAIHNNTQKCQQTRAILPANEKVYIAAWEKEEEGKRQLVVHFVNYEYDKKRKISIPIEGIKLDVSLPKKQHLMKAVFLSPEFQDKMKLRTEISANGTLHIVLPLLQTYGIVVLEFLNRN